MVGGEEDPFLDSGGCFQCEVCLRYERDAAHSVSSACSRMHNNKMSRLARHLASFFHLQQNLIHCAGDPGLTIAPFIVLAVSFGSPFFFSPQVLCGFSGFPRPLVSVRVTQQCTMEPVCQCPPPPTATPGLHQTPGHLMPQLFLLLTTQACVHTS